MKPKHLLIILALLAIDLTLIFSLLIGDTTVAILDPKGLIALKQRNLMITAVLLMLIVVIPVFILAFYVVLKYREDNPNHKKYTPDWDHDVKLQLSMWIFPTIIVLILSTIMWNATHKLEPQTPIAADTKPMTIQVVALRWKWLFIYPEQGIATVNFVNFPEDTPIAFQLTADEAPMNSFWIPQLGGQLYAMSGMVNRLNLIADETGVYYGSNAEISGKGFAGMRFPAKSLSQDDFDAWVASVKQSPNQLTFEEYTKLSQPSEDTPPAFYSSTADHLFSTIIKKYQAPMNSNGHEVPNTMAEKHEANH